MVTMALHLSYHLSFPQSFAKESHRKPLSQLGCFNSSLLSTTYTWCTYVTTFVPHTKQGYCLIQIICPLITIGNKVRWRQSLSTYHCNFLFSSYRWTYLRISYRTIYIYSKMNASYLNFSHLNMLVNQTAFSRSLCVDSTLCVLPLVTVVTHGNFAVFKLMHTPCDITCIFAQGDGPKSGVNKKFTFHIQLSIIQRLDWRLLTALYTVIISFYYPFSTVLMPFFLTVLICFWCAVISHVKSIISS